MEQWKPVVGLEGVYEVSNAGAVRRIKPAPHTRPGLVLKPSLVKGYHRFCLWNNAVARHIFGHRLVVDAFIQPLPDGMVINHINGIKNDNRVENLEITTISGNTLHGFRTLGRPPQINPQKGSKNGRAKINEADIPLIFELRASGMSQQKIADRFGIDQTSISRILLRKNWTEAT